MINKKNVLGKVPSEVGIKDAVHVAIVAVRAGSPVKPGERVAMNQYNEAVPSHKGPGLADPFRESTIPVGECFWLLLGQSEVPNVQHTWEHPVISFAPPTRPVAQNKTLCRAAKALSVTYEQIMAACEEVSRTFAPAAYPGTISKDELEEAWDTCDRYDLWSEWTEETGYEFDNRGTECCPEYEYPECPLFTV